MIHTHHRRRRAPYALTLTPGNVVNVSAAPVLLERAADGARYILADKGYDADALRLTIRYAGVALVIPGRARACIETGFCRPKDVVASPRDTTSSLQTFSAVALATLVSYRID